jgi:negative regulator of flagellin synthesis FlgM
MKVTDTKEIGALAPARAAEPARGARREPAAADRVSTSESRRVTDVARQAARAAGSARAAKLQSIEAAVRQGTYRPDPQRIAQQILDDAELAARLQAIFSK